VWVYCSGEKENTMNKKIEVYYVALAVYIVLIAAGIVILETFVYGQYESWGEIAGSYVSTLSLAATFFPLLLAFSGDGFKDEANRKIALWVFLAGIISWILPITLWVVF